MSTSRSEAAAVTKRFGHAMPIATELPPSRFRTLLSKMLNRARLAGLADHQANVRRSRKAIATLRGFEGEGADARAMAYLRKVDHFVFEEVVMSALEEAGVIVFRSRRYTGDGGIDGHAWWPGLGAGRCPIQIKRYSSAINPKHVDTFAKDVLSARGRVGLFVHCGRSGR